MDKAVEGNEDDEDKDNPLRRTNQVKPKEDGGDAEDLCRITDKPVEPVEDGAVLARWGTAAQRHERLDEAEACGEGRNMMKGDWIQSESSVGDECFCNSEWLQKALSHEWEAEFSLTYRHYSYDGMWVVMRLNLSPPVEVVSNEDEASDCQAPSEPHEESVELEREKQT